MSQAVAAALQEAITNKNLTQADVAAAASISPSQFSRILSGKKVMTLEDLGRVCEALGVSVIEVLAAADEASRELRPSQGDEEQSNVIVGGFGNNADTEEEDLPENVEEEWAGQFAASPKSDLPEDHTP